MRVCWAHDLHRKLLPPPYRSHKARDARPVMTGRRVGRSARHDGCRETRAYTAGWRVGPCVAAATMTARLNMICRCHLIYILITLHYLRRHVLRRRFWRFSH